MVLVLAILVESFVDLLTIVVTSLLSVQHCIGPENIFFLAGVFKQNSHFLYLVLLLLIELILVFEEFIHISILPFTGINIRLEGTLFHFVTVNFLLQLLKFLAHHVPRI